MVHFGPKYFHYAMGRDDSIGVTAARWQLRKPRVYCTNNEKAFQKLQAMRTAVTSSCLQRWARRGRRRRRSAGDCSSSWRRTTRTAATAATTRTTDSILSSTNIRSSTSTSANRSKAFISIRSKANVLSANCHNRFNVLFFRANNRDPLQRRNKRQFLRFSLRV